jgi:hypothetical protein
MAESLPRVSPYTENLRDRLITVTLEWERVFGVAPSITSAVSEYDAACLVDTQMKVMERHALGVQP